MRRHAISPLAFSAPAPSQTNEQHQQARQRQAHIQRHARDRSAARWRQREAGVRYNICAPCRLQRGDGHQGLSCGAFGLPAPLMAPLTGCGDVDGADALLIDQRAGVGVHDAQSQGGVLDGSGAGVVQGQRQGDGLTQRSR